MFSRRVVAQAPLRTVARRTFRSGGVKQAEKAGIDVVNADEGKLAKEVYHKLNYGIAALLPIAFVAPSALSTPIDLLLSFALPLHGHIGMNYVISDYVPKHMRRMARAGVLGVSLIMAAGLLKLSFGPGITKSLKNLWEPKKAEKKDEKKDHKKK